MLQVMLAAIPAFEAVFPSDYTETVNDASFWELRLPFECLFEVALVSNALHAQSLSTSRQRPPAATPSTDAHSCCPQVNYHATLLYFTLIPLGVAAFLGVFALLVRIASDAELQRLLYLRSPQDKVLRLRRLRRVATAVLRLSAPLVWTPWGAFGVWAALTLRAQIAQRRVGAGGEDDPSADAAESSVVRREGRADDVRGAGRVCGVRLRASLPRLALAMRATAVASAIACLACLSSTGGSSAVLALSLTLAALLSLLHAAAAALCASAISSHLALSGRRRVELPAASSRERRVGHLVVEVSVRALFVLLYLLYPTVSSRIFSGAPCGTHCKLECPASSPAPH